MGKTVRRRRFLDFWRIGETECWLTDMASQGLHLKELSTLLASFERGEPKNTNYRLDFTRSEQQSTDEQLGLYTDTGWDYVCELGEYRIFSAPKESDVSEIHANPVEQASTLKRHLKRTRRNTLIVTLFMAAAMVMLFYILFSNKTPLLTFVEGEQFTLLIVAVLIIYSLFSQIGELLTAEKLMRSLREGYPINHRADWKKLLRSRRIIIGIFGILLAVVVVFPFARFFMSSNETLSLIKNNQMHLRLADIETDSALERQPSLYIDGVDWGNFSALKWSPYAPIMITIHENGVVPGRMRLDGSGEYSPRIEVILYRLRFAWLADGIIEDLCTKYTDNENEPIQEQLEPLGSDRLFMRSTEFCHEVFANRKNTVIYVRYYGEEDIDAVVESVYAVLEGM